MFNSSKAQRGTKNENDTAKKSYIHGLVAFEFSVVMPTCIVPVKIN